MSKYVLSVEDSKDCKPVAKIIDGKMKGKILYVKKRNISDIDLFKEIGEEIDQFIESKDMVLSDSKYEKLKEILSSTTEPLRKDRKEYGELYDEFKRFKDEERDYIFKDSTLLPIPDDSDKNQVQHILVAGKSGRGKSVWVANYIHAWHKLFPKSPIYLISGKDKEDEPAFNCKKGDVGKDICKDLKQVPINYEYMNQISASDGIKPFEHFISDTKNSLVVFDDVESLEKPLLNAIKVIQESVLKCGRSKGIYSVNIRHELLDREKTKSLWTECSDVVLFIKNKGLPAQTIEYACKNKLNLSSEEIKKLYDFNSRWVMLSQCEPNYMMGENRIYLL